MFSIVNMFSIVSNFQEIFTIYKMKYVSNFIQSSKTMKSDVPN